MRRLIAFPCEGETLVGTLDEADGDTGLLIVSGGNEVRTGSHRGMAQLAARLAAQGVPVFRFDRRGIGDSTGENLGWSRSAPEVHTAATCFRMEASQLKRLIALGNCDAATALAAFGQAAGLDALILTNPWLSDRGDDGLPPAPAIRARYLARLRDPASWTRLPNFRKLFKGVSTLLQKRHEPDHARLFADLALPATVILAEGDATALAYKAAMRGTFVHIRTASHSFADAADELETAILEAIRRYSAA
ncbi:alpha/beta fold hydrolase [Sphingomonas lenta]|uniref:Alpha/beta hydrolase n=1 Tax=Sphingomonas lenta TaxID=1141887 RepID=A0A2A2SKB1_9SPHN|nr:alpha/beta fold hydrolase [Sphingomonas lenta]PAX09665.1 alpha/beta hydrolase [Sphingomonas lenta]